MAGCAGESLQILKTGTIEQRFQAGMKELNDENYLESQQFFNSIILQDPASDYADDAQFYLAESYFRNGDYKLAAFNYNRLRTAFPSSQFAKQAFFMSGESYFKSSPTYDRDQRETRYAIDVFRSFVSIYAADSLTPIASARVLALQEKLAEKDYMTAVLYEKMADYRAAVMYYERVIENYPGTSFATKAITGRAQAQSELNEIAVSAASDPK